MAIATTLTAKVIDLITGQIRPSQLTIQDGIIQDIQPVPEAEATVFLAPGFVDAHVHIESSMLPPREFARIALAHGTLATVSDPHEIANVLGLEGVQYMVDQAKGLSLHVHFGAPSCVPATGFETAGATLGPEQVRYMLEDMNLPYLAEMMNWPGVLYQDPMVMEKIAIAKSLRKPIDGHAPGLRGEQAKAYAYAGMSTDHECFTLEEALDKVEAGMHILIREGSAARNLEALHPLLKLHPDRAMLCSDDKHPDDLMEGHINLLVARLLEKGYALIDVLRAACLNPVRHYGLPLGLLQKGDPADFIVLDSLDGWKPKEVYRRGKLVAARGRALYEYAAAPTPNTFKARPIPEARITEGIKLNPKANGAYPVIGAEDGQIVTGRAEAHLALVDGKPQANTEQDVLLISVLNRYAADVVPATAFIKGFGLKEGAIASSVAHDSHNVVCVGTSPEWMAQAINLVVAAKGGLSAAGPGVAEVLPLPIAGLMSDKPAPDVGNAYRALTRHAHDMGCTLKAPFMALSFMALPVIPSLKMTDLGLFDGESFNFVESSE